MSKQAETVGDLDPAPYNPRKITKDRLEVLGRSLREFGDLSGIVYNRRSRMLVGGHQRKKHLDPKWKIEKTASKDKTGTVAVGYIQTPWGLLHYREVDWPERREIAANIAANRHGADWDLPKYKENLVFLDDGELDLTILGETDSGLKKLIDWDPAGTGSEPPQAGSPPAVPETKHGDLIHLGGHKLFCGDAGRAESFKKLMEGMAAMVFTDPPWNVKIGKDSNPRHRQRGGLENDDLSDSDFQKFILGWAPNLLQYLAGDIYCVFGCSQWALLDTSLRSVGFHWSGTINWVKDSFVLGGSKYHSRYEPIWYGWPKGQKSSFRGERNLDDVWEIPRPKVSKEHPTMKPVALVERAIVNSSVKGDVVLDPFGGSGTTLLACEKTGRVARIMEISPAYVDVAVDRWEKMTGKKAKRP